jgi:serine-type D-Ala-D-Ala carboxypeptidase
MALTQAHELMVRALAEGMFTGAVLRVSQRGESLLEESYGILGPAGTPRVCSRTLFDLASLTKVMATTPCWMILAAREPGILDLPLSHWFPEAPADKQAITLRLLLAHSSGLPAWRPYYLHGDIGSPEQLTLERILHEPLAYPLAQGWVYSDLGFILLAAILARETGQPLDAWACENVFEPLGVAGDLLFRPNPDLNPIVWTRPEERAGSVNDLNTRAMGGMSGHAGLFGTGRGVTAIAQEILRSLRSDSSLFDSAVTRAFSTRAGYVAESTRALGFDTPSPEGSSSGSFFPPQSLGHTGFTGTSLWIDPQRALIVTLLTNRVFMGESDNRIKAFRPILHDAIMEAV